jgi:hypothetical protein
MVSAEDAVRECAVWLDAMSVMIGMSGPARHSDGQHPFSGERQLVSVVAVQLEAFAGPEVDDETGWQDVADWLSVWRHTTSAYAVLDASPRYDHP